MSPSYGSALSCRQFNISINDISHNSAHEVSGTHYVVDVAITTSSSYVPTAERLFQTAINRINNICASNYFFKMSTAKTTQ